MKKGVLRNFAQFTEKHLCQSLFFKKVAGLRPATLLKKRFWHRCFPVNFVKFPRTPFYRTHPGDCFLHFCIKKLNCDPAFKDQILINWLTSIPPQNIRKWFSVDFREIRLTCLKWLNVRSTFDGDHWVRSFNDNFLKCCCWQIASLKQLW